MRTLPNTGITIKYFFVIALICCNLTASNAQDLLTFLDNCSNCCGKVKKISTRQKANLKDYRSPVIFKTEEFNKNEQLVKTEISVEGRVSKTIHYFYIDSLLIYEHHISPELEDYFLVYQYYKKQLPTRIIKVDTDHKIINYSEISYSTERQPVYLKFYSILGELLEKRSVEYYSKNQVVIRSFHPKSQIENLQKYELLCKFNQPEKLKKRDFRDIITRPINLIVQDDMVRVVKAVQVENKEKVQIEEVSYDDNGNWLSKKTYELKNNKNKKRLIKKIEREIEYY